MALAVFPLSEKVASAGADLDSLLDDEGVSESSRRDSLGSLSSLKLAGNDKLLKKCL